MDTSALVHRELRQETGRRRARMSGSEMKYNPSISSHETTGNRQSEQEQGHVAQHELESSKGCERILAHRSGIVASHVIVVLMSMTPVCI